MCFDLAKEMPNYDYWVAKTYILLADNYVRLKDNFQAKATLQSIIDNYKGKDDILSTARQKMGILTGKPVKIDTPATDTPAASDSTATDTTGNNAAPADTTKTPGQN